MHQKQCARIFIAPLFIITQISINKGQMHFDVFTIEYHEVINVSEPLLYATTSYVNLTIEPLRVAKHKSIHTV